MTKHITSVLCIMLCMIFTLTLSACGEKETSSETPSVTSSNDTSSLVPVTVFFPDEYIKLKSSKEGNEDITVKGNIAVKLSKSDSKIYDPSSFESAPLEGEYKMLNGFGVGSKTSDFADTFGIKYGFCHVVNKDGQAIEFSELGKTATHAFAVLTLSDDGKVSYMSAADIIKHASNILDYGNNYISTELTSKDLIVVEMYSEDALTVTSLTISHFTA